MKRNVNSSMMRRMLGTTAAVIIICFGSILVNLLNLQIVNSSELQKKATKQQMRVTTLEPQRGTIYDTNMKVLAKSATAYSVMISPASFRVPDSATDSERQKIEKNRDMMVDGLYRILEMEKEEILAFVEKKSAELTLKKRVEREVADSVRNFVIENEIYGIRLVEDSKRYYPYENFAATVIGCTGYDNQGLSGLEGYYESYLKGTSGRIVAAKDALGSDMPFKYETLYEPTQGYNLVLTIDETIQHFLEKHLDAAVVEHQVKNKATGIVMDVNTGEILAMSTKPDFDPNKPFEITDPNVLAELELLEGDEYNQRQVAAYNEQWRNKAISDTYEPGSTFKVLTAAAGLEEGVVSPNDSFYCNGFLKMDEWDKAVGCWKTDGHGAQTFVEGLKHSCNPVFMNVGVKMGKENYMKYFSAFGLDELTRIDLPGEAESIPHSSANLSSSHTLAVSSFGQTFKITPIQLITAVSAVVNGGKLMQPYVVRQIIDNDNNIIEQTTPTVKRQVISESVSRDMALYLEKVVGDEDGSGKYAYKKGYRIGGKTATSEKLDKVNPDTGAKDLRITSFYGVAPADDPKVAVLVILDEPYDPTSYGSVLAAPVVGNIFEDILPYIGIEPVYTEEELNQIDIKVPDLLDMTPEVAEAEVDKLMLKCEIIGEGSKIVKQVPEYGYMIPRGGKIVLYTENEDAETTAVVPDVIGRTPQEVNTILKNAGFNVRLSGASLNEQGAISVSQSHGEGNVADKGTVITVNFKNTQRVGE